MSFKFPMLPTRATTYVADRHSGPAWMVIRSGWPADFNTFMTFCNGRAIVSAKSEVPALRQRYQCIRRCTIYTASVLGCTRFKHLYYSTCGTARPNLNRDQLSYSMNMGMHAEFAKCGGKCGGSIK